MDPYVERYWEGAHARLIGYVADALATQLPDDLMRQVLPNISIPLRPNDPEVTVELQPLIDRTYRLSRFDRIDYSRPCEQPLSEDDAAWARERIAAAAGNPV